MTPILHGVYTGCQVTADGSDLVLTISSGTYINQNVIQVPSVTAFTATSGDPSFDRYDTLYADSAGGISAITGVADGTLAQPDSTDVVLARYIVRAGATAIQSADIQDVRSFSFPEHPANTMAFTFLNTALSAADPGSGNFGFDSTTVGSIAHLYVNYQTPSWPYNLLGNYKKLGGWLSGGFNAFPYWLRIWSRQRPNIFVQMQVTGQTDHGSWADLTVSNFTYVTNDVGPPVAAVHLLTDAFDSIFECMGAVAPTIPTLTSGTSAITADTTVSSTAFTDGPTTGSIGANGQVFLLTCNATVSSATASTRNVTIRLWDGTTTFAETELQLAVSSPGTGTLTALVSPSAATTYKLSARASGNNVTLKAAAPDNSGASVATQITWVRLT